MGPVGVDDLDGDLAWARRDWILNEMYHHFLQMQWYLGILNNTLGDFDAILQEIK